MKKKQIITCLTFIFLLGSFVKANASEYKALNHKKNISNIKSTISEMSLSKDEIDIEVKPLENSGLYYYKLSDGSVVFTTSNGEYMIKGSILKVDNNKFKRLPIDKNLKLNRDMLYMLSDDDLIIYPANTKTDNILFVFMDYTCPYCKKLHRDVVPKLNKNGIEVRYIPFSRNPFDNRVEKNLINIFCLDDNKKKQDAINKAFFKGKNTKFDNNEKCNKEQAIKSILQISHFMKIEGSPSIYTIKGEYIGGYNNYQKILELINSGT